MSYARPLARSRGLGALDEWTNPSLHSFLPSDVFVLRLATTGFPVRGPADVLPLVRAVGRGQNLRLDVRGVALWQDPKAAPDVWHADVVLTTAAALFPFAPLMPGFVDDGAAMAGKVDADAGMRGAFPTFHVVGQVFGQLTAPPDAIDHWRSQPVLWDHVLGPAGVGGPTDSFAKPADYSIVRGKVDDGARATPWILGRSPLAPPPPGGPSGTVVVVVGIALAGLLALHFVKGQGKRR